MQEPERPEPTGARHEVAVNDLFFSTTDHLGVIEQANSVFVFNSRYRRDQLVGAPHSIIRHPSMPGGAFLIVWDALLSGKPTCAYVNNLASDGSMYSVFATLTPLGDGFLSVRMRPGREDLFGAACSLYAAVRPHELQLRDEGVNAHDAAVAGAGELGELLAGAGFPSYEDFVLLSLPAEVEARAKVAEGIPQRPDARGPFAETLGAAWKIREEFTSWLAVMAELASVASQLTETTNQLRQGETDREATVQQILDVGAETPGFTPILLGVNVWAAMSPQLGEGIEALLIALKSLTESSAVTRFRIALASLHNDTIGYFAAELIDDVPGSDQAAPAIHLLSRALNEGLTVTVEQMAKNASLAGRIATEADAIRETLEMTLALIEWWLQMVAGREEEAVRRLVPVIEAQVQRTREDIIALGGLVERCTAIAEPLDTTTVNEQLKVISDAVELVAVSPRRADLSAKTESLEETPREADAEPAVSEASEPQPEPEPELAVSETPQPEPPVSQDTDAAPETEPDSEVADAAEDPGDGATLELEPEPDSTVADAATDPVDAATPETEPDFTVTFVDEGSPATESTATEPPSTAPSPSVATPSVATPSVAAPSVAAPSVATPPARSPERPRWSLKSLWSRK